MNMAKKNSGGGSSMGGGMDPFEEFEFKPLTDGLGFHKKSISLKDGLKRSGVIEDQLQTVPVSMPKSFLEEAPKVGAKKHTFDDVLSALEKTPLNRKELQFTEPLARESDRAQEKRRAMEIEMPRPVQSPFPFPDAYKSPGAQPVAKAPNQQSAGVRRGASDSPMRKLVPTSGSFASAFLYLIIVLAFTMVFVIALMMVTKVDLSIVMRNLDRDLMTQISLVSLFIAVMQMYVVIGRSFFGQTIGEWTFDMQLGMDDEQTKQSYPLKVAWRSLINIATGLVLLPLISAVFDKDIAGWLSGVRLYRQNT
jgi:hypothetical protein